MNANSMILGFPPALILMLATDAGADIPRGFFTDVMPVLVDADFSDFRPVVSRDGLTMVFANGRESREGLGQEDLWMATRTTKAEAFGDITNLGPEANSSGNEDPGSLSADGQTLYFGSDRSGGDWDIYRASRNGNTFEDVERLGNGVNTDVIENAASISQDARTIYFHRIDADVPGAAHRLWSATRDNTNSAFETAVDLGDELNGPDGSPVELWFPSISADETVIFFSDWTRRTPRAGGEGFSDIWVGTRPTKDDTFGSPINLNQLWPGTDINTDVFEGAPYISPDWPAPESNLYFTSNLLNPDVGDLFQATWVSLDGLQAGDANQDLQFDQLDLVRVQQAGKYLTAQQATWGEGDWNGAPGGEPGDPPNGNGRFDQFDVIAALAAGTYLTGPYAAIEASGQLGDGQTSLVYHADTGEVAVDSPAGVELTSINVDSAAGIFTAEASQNLGGSFDNDADGNIFKATFGGSFGSFTFGYVAQPGLSADFVLGDLSVVGSLAGGGDLGRVDLVYVPEPATLGLLVLGLLFVLRRV